MAALEQELEALEFEGELEAEAKTELEAEAELETELEFEAEGELESEISPVRKIYPDAMMEHMAHMAAEAETEQEAAEHFLPLIGMAASKLIPVVAKAAGPLLRKALPRVARAVTQVTPQLTRGISTITRRLHRNPATRRFIHAVPSIARRTVHSVAKQAAQGRAITPRTAVRTLARQTRNVLAHPPRRVRALRQARVLDRQLHRTIAPGIARPHASQAGLVAAPGGAYPAGRWVPARVPTGSTMRTGACVCPPCPRCNSSLAAQPAYCRCCGQVLR